MDPLSIFVSVVGLLTAVGSVTTFLGKLVRNTACAPELARHVMTEVYGIGSCLGGLAPFLLGTKAPSISRTSMIMVDQVVVTLTECMTTFSDLEKALEPLKSTKPNTVMKRVRWVMKEQTFRRILSRLQTSKISLNLMLTMLSCLRSEEARDCGKELHHIVQEALSNNYDLLKRVRSLETRHGLASECDSMKSGAPQDILDDNVTTRSQIYVMASQLPISQTTTCSYTFQQDLPTSPVYSRAHKNHSTLSLPSTTGRTTGWSLFSGTSLSDISNISAFALPISACELYNCQAYTITSQRPRIAAKEGISVDLGYMNTTSRKVLILGDTRSGKSTIFKQFRLLSGDRFTSQDRRDAVNPIRVVLEDSISDMYECLIGIKNSGIKFGDERSRAFQIIVLENKYPLNYLHDSFIRVIAAVKALWRDQLVQNFMYTKIGLQHNNIAHYLNNAERIVERCFIPSDQDILGLWTQSTGVYSRPMMIKDVIYNVYDVGGARSERKKWVHSFEAVDCVIFTVGLSDYNEYWYGDMNTLEESLELFKSIITGKWFTKSAFFLVFTKVDFFKEKLIHDPLENHFPDYRGGRDPSHALEYWEQRFIDLKPHPDRQLHIQFAATAASFKDTIVVMHFFMQEQLSLARRQHGVIVATTGSTSHARHDSSKQNKAGPDSPQRFDNQSAQHRQPLKADADPEEKESDALLRFDFELFDGGISSTTSPEVLRSRPGAL